MGSALFASPDPRLSGHRSRTGLIAMWRLGSGVLGVGSPLRFAPPIALAS